MSLALRRFRLDGIGPPGARFDPLAVDLAADDRAARTAVLFLENGGGKSVLLRLLFSVVLPGRRYTVGSVKLDSYVGSGDTGHVMLEWETGQRPLVTGLLLEWRNRTRSGSASNLRHLWYSFVPKAGVLTLDDLPTRDGDRRVTRTGFRERLAAVARDHPELELVVVEDQPGRWAEHLLRSTPLDPEIFRYQRQMNADEADAESLFSGIRTDEDFVRFVVEAVHDPEQLEGFDELLSEYAVQLGRHDDLALEARFCDEAATVLRPLGAAAADLAQARARATDEQRATDRLRAELVAGAEGAEAGARRRGDESSRAARRAETLGSEAKRVGDVAAEMRRLEAVFRLKAAEKAAREAKSAAEAATRTAAAWASVGTVVDLRRHDTQLRELRAAQERAESELAPLREAMDTAAAAYGRRLLAEADELEAEASRAEREGGEATQQAGALAERSAAAERAAGEAAAEARALWRRVEEVAAAIARVRETGTLGRGEPLDEGHQRAVRETAELGQTVEHLRARRRVLEARQRELRGDLTAVHGDQARLDAQLTGARSELDGHRAAGAALVEHPRVQEIAPDAADAWLVAERLEQVLDGSVQAAEAAERSLRTAIDDLDARLERLGTDGLLPAAPDVVRVYDAVVARGIGAVTGWSFLARGTEEDRVRLLATNPALAGGVIVADPERLDDAVKAVEDAEVETESVVLLGTADQLEQPGAGRAAPVRPALYDPGWTERTRKGLDAERIELVERQEAEKARLAVDAPLLNEVRDFRRRCSLAKRDALVATVDDLDGKLRALRADLTRLDEEARAVSTELDQMAETEPDRVAQQQAAGEVVRALQDLVERQRAAEGWEQEAVQAEQRSDERSTAARELAGEADAQRQRAESARRRADQSRSDAARRRDQATAIPLPAALPPDDDTAAAGRGRAEAPTEELAGRYEAARQAYEAERAGRDLTPQIERAELAREACARQLAELGPDVRAEAEALAGMAGVEDPEVRRTRVAEARQEASRLDDRRGQCQAQLGASKQQVADRSPRGRARFVTLDRSMEPPDAEAAARAAAEHQARVVALNQEVRQAQAEIEQRRQQQQEAANRAALLRSTIDALPVPLDAAEHQTDDGSATGRDSEEGPLASAPVIAWQGGTEDAKQAVVAARRRFDEAERDVTAREKVLSGAVAEVRRVANDPTLAAVGGVRLALANEPIDSLAGRALTLAAELDGMRASIESELAEARQHREGIVQRLATLVEGQLRQLKLLARLSTLPPGLGDWSGKPFVSVDFEQVAGGEITARLGPIVDEAAADPRKRNGVDLLLAGMRAAVVHQKGDTERTYSVRLLRPNRMMSFQRATMAELEREFSGGMKLTAAICTYCALAALRATSRSTGSLFGLDPGPLFLDNPLGKASADYLLELQHALADKLKVQLVHTTGVWDVEALATYERVVRLRNLADLRRNVRRLRVDDDVHLPGSGATIDAVAFTVRRPPTPQATS